MNVPEKALEEVLKILPSNTSPTINQTQKPGWLAISSLIPKKDVNILSLKLLRLGVDGIVPSEQDMVFTQSLKDIIKI